VKPSEAAQYIVAALGGGEPVVEVAVVASDSTSTQLGERLMVWEGGHAGSLGGTHLDEQAIDAAREVLRSRKARALDLGLVSVFLEPHYPPDDLLIVGAGHIARPLCRFGAMLGYRVTVLDDRPGFATRERFPEAERVIRADFSDPFQDVALGRGTHLILVTRGHKYDYDALRDVLLRDVELAYIGMVGSQRRVRAALEQLVKEGIPRGALEKVYAPIGLDIGAETPEEIAVSIVGELVRVRRGGTGVSLRDQARVMERWIAAPRSTESGSLSE
jgi:xanthine dehydrogenase accessory factor